MSENKVLTHPSSVDSITTSGGTEDHVSMGGFAARKAVNVVEHVEHGNQEIFLYQLLNYFLFLLVYSLFLSFFVSVVAIELLAACQALEFHRPKKTTAPLEEVYKVVRLTVPESNKDHFMAPNIQSVTELLQDGKVC